MVDHPYEAHRFVFEEMKKLKLPGMAILDVGCGKGLWALLLRADLPGATEAYIVGAEVDKQAIVFAREHRAYDDIIQCDIAHLPLRPASFDQILAFEVI